MDHAVTIGDILRMAGAAVGLTLMVIAVLILLAEGMSDAPDTNGGGGIAGCALGVGGIALFLVSIAAWVF